MLEAAPRRTLGRSLLGSILAHAGVLGLVLLAMSLPPHLTSLAPPDQSTKVVYLPSPHAGGGGGGRPTPLTKAALPKPPQAIHPPEPVPLTPPPSLLSLITPSSTVLAFGESIALTGPGKGGVTPGPGTGAGPGGPGKGGPGCCGDTYGSGNGVTDPVPIYSPNPTYTPDAMRAKIQGIVEISGVVDVTGQLVDAHVSRSLDRVYGLDAAAVKTAESWRFRPGMKDGKPVRVYVTIQMQFTLR